MGTLKLTRMTVVFLGGLVVGAPSLVTAQPRASERGSVAQKVNGAQVTIDYSRPVARGRDNLFGGVIHWGEVWTPGANWATTFETDRDLTVSGHPVSAGKYSVWVVPQADEWAVRLHEQDSLYHDSPVPEDGFLFEFPVTPESGAHMEALAWYFPVVGPRAATLRMHWGDTYISLEIETAPIDWETPSADVRAPLLGTYALSGTDPTTFQPLEFPFSLVEEDGRLMGRWGRAPVALLPTGNELEFYIGFMRNGELFDVGEEMTIGVVMDGDRASAVELRWYGEPTARGERVPDASN